ncbi:MAG: hypothetical protein WDN03_07970 [Rhizomicrobium sp.]
MRLPRGAGQDGGKVSIVASNAARIRGSIKAAGAAGGTIETSGHILSVGGATVDAGNGGQWLLDPYDLTVDAPAAATINSSLGAGTNVTLQTTASGTAGPGTPNASGNGDIFIDSPIAWSTAAAFTLSAYRNIDINAAITASGAGALSLTTGTGTAGDYLVAAPSPSPADRVPDRVRAPASRSTAPATPSSTPWPASRPSTPAARPCRAIMPSPHPSMRQPPQTGRRSAFPAPAVPTPNSREILPDWTTRFQTSRCRRSVTAFKGASPAYLEIPAVRFAMSAS